MVNSFIEINLVSINLILTSLTVSIIARRPVVLGSPCRNSLEPAPFWISRGPRPDANVNTLAHRQVPIRSKGLGDLVALSLRRPHRRQGALAAKLFFLMKLAAKISGLVSRADGLTSQVIKTRKQVGGALADFFFYFVLFCSRRNHLQMSCRNRVACHHGGMDRCLALWGRVRRGKGHGRQQLLVICPHRVTCCDRKIARRCISSDLFEI